MWKTLMLARVLTMPVLAAAAQAEPAPAARCGGCVIEHPFTKTIRVDIQGRLSQKWVFLPSHPVHDIAPRLVSHWQITVQGKSYELDFNGGKGWNALAQKSDGRMVRVTGRLEQRIRFRNDIEAKRTLPSEIAIPRRPQSYWVVVVERFESVVEEYVREHVEFEIRGLLLVDQKIGLPERVVTTLTAQGQTFVLELGRGTSRLARQLHGKTVAVKGTLAGQFTLLMWTCPPPNHPQPGFPIVAVRTLAAAQGEGVIRTERREIQGPLGPMNRIPDLAWNDDGLPNWKITVDGKTYELEFEHNYYLLARAKQLAGKTVKIKGRLEKRAYTMVRRSHGNHPVLKDARREVREVLVVESMEEIVLEKFQQTETVQARGRLGFLDGHYVLQVGGRNVRVEFDTPIPMAISMLLGKTLDVTGRLETRFDFCGTKSAMPRGYEVLVVTQFRVVG